MGDEDHRKVQIALKVGQKIDDLGLNRHIERGNRLIADQKLRFHDQRAGDADPLTLTAGKFVRIAVDLVRQQADAVHHRLDPDLHLG